MVGSDQLLLQELSESFHVKRYRLLGDEETTKEIIFLLSKPKTNLPEPPSNARRNNIYVCRCWSHHHHHAVVVQVVVVVVIVIVVVEVVEVVVVEVPVVVVALIGTSLFYICTLSYSIVYY